MEHSQAHTLGPNQRQNGSVPYPELVMTRPASEREMKYYAALELVARIDEELTRGTRHYRNRAGTLLTTLDEVVRAILGDDLMLPEEEKDIVWIAQELAA